MAKVGVILSGCGVYDGSEIHEAVISLLALNRAGADVVSMAPNMEQTVINHLTGEPAEGASRNVLEESARIVRGEIQDIAKVDTTDLDALFIPGGFVVIAVLAFNFLGDGMRDAADPYDN